jgi:MFS family permease
VAFLGSTPVGGPVAGWMAEAFGVRVALCVGAATAILSGAVVLLTTKPGRPSAAATVEPVDPDPEILAAA